MPAGQEYWCQRRDSNSQTPVSKTGCYSNSHTLALWCTGEDLNLRVPLGETGLQPVRFGRAHAPVQTWRKVDESNAHRSSRCPGFQDPDPVDMEPFRTLQGRTATGSSRKSRL